MNSKKILVLNAHPDDSEMAMGGSLLLFSQSGHEVLNVCLTKGQSGTYGNPEVREKEFYAAQEFLGSKALMWDYHDTSLEVSREIVLKVVSLIREYKPDLIFAPYLRNDRASYDGMANRDHAIVGEIASQAMKLARLKSVLPESAPHMVQQLFFYMIPSGVFPSLLIDVSDVMDKWKKLLHCYESQLSITGIEEMLIAMRLAHGREARLLYGEAFVTEMPIVLSPLAIL